MDSLSEVLGAAGCPGGVAYTLRPDAGHSWFAHLNGAWQATDGTGSSADLAAELTPAVLVDFGRQVGRGGLQVRAFPRSDGATPCSLSAVNLSGPT